MEFRILTDQEYSKFINSQEQVAFQQIVAMRNMRKNSGWETYFLGITSGNEVLGAGLITGRKLRIGKYYECNYGPILNYENKKEVDFFFQELKKFLKTKGASHFSVNPNVKRSVYDLNGNKLKEGSEKNVTTELPYNAEKLTKQLEKLGYVHHDLGEDRNGQWDMRWFFIKNLEGLTEENLLGSFNSQAKRSTKRALNSTLIVREIEERELEKFKGLMALSAEKQGYSDKSIEYYRNLKAQFKENVKYMIVEVNIIEHMSNLQETLAQTEKQLDVLRSKENKQKQMEDLERKKDRIQKDIVKYQESLRQKKRIIGLSAGVFIETPSEMVYLFGGNDAKYQEFGSSYRLQYDMMLRGIQKGLPEYNFYGVEGVFDGSDGVLKFKQGFGGYVVENVGTFTIKIDKFKYFSYNAIKKIFKR